MSQTNYTPISLYYTTVSGRPVPAGTLIPGELALNAADGTLFYYNTTNTAIQQITVGSATTATNLAGGAAGSLPYQSGAGATTFLGIGAANTVLTSSGTAPQYVAQSTLSVGSATNLTGGAALRIPYQSAANTTAFVAAPSTSGDVLTYNGTNLVWGAGGGGGVTSFAGGTTGLTPTGASTGAVTLGGTLATTNGGTGLTSFTSGGAVYATSTSALATGTLPVASGGTGATTLMANNVILGNGTSAVQTVAPGASGNVLTSNGTTWVSQAASGGGSSSKTWSAYTATGTYTVPAGVSSIRAYAFGAGGNGGASGGGSGGGCAFGDIAVTAGATININIAGGVATLVIGGTTYLTANPGGNNMGAAGTASKNIAVTSGGAYSGGVGGSFGGGGSSGSPLGNGYNGGASGGGGGGAGGAGGGYGGGGGAGGAGQGQSPGDPSVGYSGGGAGGAASIRLPGQGRYGNFFSDPLMTPLTSSGGLGGYDTTSCRGQVAGAGGGGGGAYNSASGSAFGGNGGAFGGGGGAISSSASSYGGIGGFGGGGGSGSQGTGGNGGFGGGGGYGGQTQGTGGSAIVLIYA